MDFAANTDLSVSFWSLIMLGGFAVNNVLRVFVDNSSEITPSRVFRGKVTGES